MSPLCRNYVYIYHSLPELKNILGSHNRIVVDTWKQTTSELIELAKYIEATWLLSRTWSPDRWSVFGQSVRTNNDVEGWHNRLKNRAHRNMPFYRLIETLERESRWTSLSCRSVSESKLCRHQRQKYRRQQGQ